MLTAFKLRMRPAPQHETLARLFHRCFSTEDGQKMLEHLHQRFLFRQADPRLSDEELRFQEGQRHVVLYLCALAAASATPLPVSSNP